MKTKLFYSFALLLSVSVVVSGCGGTFKGQYWNNGDYRNLKDYQLARLNTWAGATKDEIALVKGIPTRSAQISDTTEVWEFSKGPGVITKTTTDSVGFSSLGGLYGTWLGSAGSGTATTTSQDKTCTIVFSFQNDIVEKVAPKGNWCNKWEAYLYEDGKIYQGNSNNPNPPEKLQLTEKFKKHLNKNRNKSDKWESWAFKWYRLIGEI